MEFIVNTLIDVLYDMLWKKGQPFGFLYDEAPEHFRHLFRGVILDMYHVKWIYPGGPKSWTA